MNVSKGARPGRSRGSELLENWRGGMLKWQAALVLGIDYGAFCAFVTGYRKPGAKRALVIEEKTNGKVPVGSWDQRPVRKSRAA